MAKPATNSKPQGTGVRARIQARKTAKVTKFATMKRIAANEPHEFHRALAQLEAGFGAIKASLTELRNNLGLVSIPKSADLKTRIAAKREYASRFRRIAEEAPEELAGAMSEVYLAIDGLAEDMENLADNMGIPLEVPTETEGVADGFESEPVEIAEEEHEVVEEAEEAGLPVPEEVEEHVEEEEEVEEHEASGSDWFSTDRDEKGEPKAPVVASKRPVVKTR
jgi:hypothetical protein